jgi:hypothetical protein
MLIWYLPVFCLLRGGILYVRYHGMPNVTTRWREMVTGHSRGPDVHIVSVNCVLCNHAWDVRG